MAPKQPLFRGRVEDGVLHPQGVEYSFGVRPGHEIQTLTTRAREFCLVMGRLIDNTDPDTVLLEVDTRLVRTGRVACWPPKKWKPPRSPVLRVNLLARRVRAAKKTSLRSRARSD